MPFQREAQYCTSGWRKVHEGEEWPGFKERRNAWRGRVRGCAPLAWFGDGASLRGVSVEEPQQLVARARLLLLGLPSARSDRVDNGRWFGGERQGGMSWSRKGKGEFWITLTTKPSSPSSLLSSLPPALSSSSSLSPPLPRSRSSCPPAASSSKTTEGGHYPAVWLLTLRAQPC